MWDTVVPVDAPRYKIFEFLSKFILLKPLCSAADSLDLLGFHILYSILDSSSIMSFSPYTLLDGMLFIVAMPPLYYVAIGLWRQNTPLAVTGAVFLTVHFFHVLGNLHGLSL